MLFAALIFTGCKESKTEKSAVDESQETIVKGGDEETGIVEITPAQMKSVGIETDTLQQRDLTAVLKVNGVLAVPNQNKALVTSITNGVIRTLLVQPGDLVTKRSGYRYNHQPRRCPYSAAASNY